jgi:exodeoxyribonuclease VII large subunit
VETLEGQRRRLGRALHANQLGLRNRLVRCARSYVFREPQHLLDRYRERLRVLAAARTRSLQTLFQQRQQRLDDLATRYVFQEPVKLLARYRERMALLAAAVARQATDLVRDRRRQQGELDLRLEREGRAAVDRGRQVVRRLEAQLRALSPEAVLTRGYSLTCTEEGAVVNRAGEVAVGQRLITRLARGTIASRVEDTTEDSDHGDQE